MNGRPLYWSGFIRENGMQEGANVADVETLSRMNLHTSVGSYRLLKRC
jgi:hypothetical protein